MIITICKINITSFVCDYSNWKPDLRTDSQSAITAITVYTRSRYCGDNTMSIYFTDTSTLIRNINISNSIQCNTRRMFKPCVYGQNTVTIIATTINCINTCNCIDNAIGGYFTDTALTIINNK